VITRFRHVCGGRIRPVEALCEATVEPLLAVPAGTSVTDRLRGWLGGRKSRAALPRPVMLI
jgi:hypothetical protein